MISTMVVDGYVWVYLDPWRIWCSGNATDGFMLAPDDYGPELNDSYMVEQDAAGCTVELWDAMIEALPVVHQLTVDVLETMNGELDT